MGRNMIGNLPYTTLEQINAEILNMPEDTESQKRDKQILYLYFHDGLSTSEIAAQTKPLSYANVQNDNVSKRTIQVIIKKYYPDVHKTRSEIYQKKHPKRRDMIAQKAMVKEVAEDKNRIKICAFCGGTDKLELHHMIPLAAGGDNHSYNCIWLCRKCHSQVTNYQKEKEMW